MTKSYEILGATSPEKRSDQEEEEETVLPLARPECPKALQHFHFQPTMQAEDM